MRISSIYNPNDAKRAKWEQIQNQNMKKLLGQATTLAASISSDELDDWDKASIAKAAELADRDTAEEMRRAIARIYELAGLHYGISKQQFWQRYNQQRSLDRAAG